MNRCVPIVWWVPLAVAFLLSANSANGKTEDAARQTELRPIELTCVDQEAIGYATFQSHNQKVVANQFGIFVTYLSTRNEDYTAQTWHLSRSTDGGRTFGDIFKATHATNPPVLETDDQGNVYLVRPDFTDGHAYLYRFLTANEFRDPVITTIPGGSAGKYAMYLDQSRHHLYYFAHNNTFHVIGLDGEVRSSRQLLSAGKNAVLQYPLLSMADDNTLHAAWTTQKHDLYLYWDIHHMLSPDGGQTWRGAGGTMLSEPIVADDTGAALRITLEDEYEAHTWLSSFLVKESKMHFLYLAQTTPPRQHYMRYDAVSGKREIDRQPELRGQQVRLFGLDGFFVTRSSSESGPVYCLGNDDGRVGCLVSHDNGQTWQDFARSREKFNLYSLGGCRQLTKDGAIIGSFTDQSGSNLTPDRKSKVYFFRISTD